MATRLEGLGKKPTKLPPRALWEASEQGVRAYQDIMPLFRQTGVGQRLVKGLRHT